jgi:uncharacterized integral membrane protein
VADDFDRELEEATQQASAGAEPEAEPAAEAEAPAEVPAAHAMSARKPGAVGRAAERLTDAVAGVHVPRMDTAAFLYILLALIAAAFLAENWAPVRVNVFGLYADVPKALAFVVTLAAGAGLLWLWQRHRGPGGPQGEA